MAHNAAQLTGVERHFPDNSFIISMTDTKGVLTYANDIFLQIADYTEDEVLGQQHNILRHPDMPRCIFNYLWTTIAGGEEMLAYVVNKTKFGDHYWVLAQVTPTYDENNKIIGYLSSRRTVTKQALNFIKPLYAQLRAEEEKYSSKKNGMEAAMNILRDTLKTKKVSYTQLIMGL